MATTLTLILRPLNTETLFQISSAHLGEPLWELHFLFLFLFPNHLQWLNISLAYCHGDFRDLKPSCGQISTNSAIRTSEKSSLKKPQKTTDKNCQNQLFKLWTFNGQFAAIPGALIQEQWQTSVRTMICVALTHLRTLALHPMVILKNSPFPQYQREQNGAKVPLKPHSQRTVTLPVCGSLEDLTWKACLWTESCLLLKASSQGASLENNYR